MNRLRNVGLALIVVVLLGLAAFAAGVRAPAASSASAGGSGVGASSSTSPSPSATTPTVAYTFSDFFNVPYGEWWDWRLGLYGDRAIGADCFNASSITDGICKDMNGDGKVTSETYPYTNWYPAAIGVITPGKADPTIYAPYRMGVAASNLPNFTVTKPVMLPICTDLAATGTTGFPACPTTLPGGTSVGLVWDFNYLDMKSATWADNVCGTSTVSSEDGFIAMNNVTLTMDLGTASRLFGSPTSSSGNAQTWWNTYTNPTCPTAGPVEKAFANWMQAQGGTNAKSGVYDIWSAYQYFVNPLATNFVATVASDGTTTVKITSIGWGAEVLLARWFFWGPAAYTTNFNDPTKAQGWWGMELPWFEYFHMTATIGASTNLNINTVMQYSLQQGATPGPDGVWGTPDDVSTWLWQSMLADYIQPANGAHPDSELSLYLGSTYLHTQCGSIVYGQQYAYDLRPQNWKIKPGESLIFHAPTTPIPYCDVYASPHGSATGASDPNTLVFHSALATLMDTVPTPMGAYDASTNTLTITGPVSNGLSAVQPPYGVPWVEWSAPALLRVTTNPAVAGKILVDNVPRDEWGLAWAKMSPGAHTVSFSGLNGFVTPAAQAVTLTPGQTTTVQGNYVANGFLRVITSPAVASTIYVNGEPRDDWGMWTALPPGTYTVHFGAVAGYNPPPDQTATVTAGTTFTVTGNFVANPSATGPDPSTYGMLRVTTNPAWAAQILVNAIPMDDWGLAWVKLAPGTYTVSFGDAYGVTQPAPQTFTVTAGATTTYDAAFTVHGSLRVTTSPALPGTIYVNGQPMDDWGMWQSVAPGTYTVGFGFVAGYVTPAPQTVTVTSGGYTPVTGTYVAAALASPALASASPLVSAPLVSATAVSGGATTSVMAVSQPTSFKTEL